MTINELLSDIDMRTNIDGKSWTAYSEDGKVICRAPSKSILKLKAIHYLGRLCFNCKSDWGEVK